MISLKDEEFVQLAGYIKANYGIHLKDEKRTLLSGRLNRTLEEKNMSDFSEYYSYILSDKTGIAENDLVDKITTNHTFFMRESEHYEYFRENLLPYFEKTIKEKDLRIWSAGCSTGEEPAVLAMIIDEYFEFNKINWDTKILATDISNRVLEIAKEGIYTNENLSPLPPAWKLNYFKYYDDERSKLVDRIKDEIIYRKFNLMNETFPFKKKFHVIFCRNVMIYFDNITRYNLINKFYEITEDGGYLFIGHSESIQRDETKYKYIMPSLYRKI